MDKQTFNKLVVLRTWLTDCTDTQALKLYDMLDSNCSNHDLAVMVNLCSEGLTVSEIEQILERNTPKSDNMRFIVGRSYIIKHRLKGIEVTSCTETLRKISHRKDGKLELTFAHGLGTFYPISPRKRYGILSIKEVEEGTTYEQ